MYEPTVVEVGSVPDYGAVLVRSRLLRLLERAGGRPIVIAAASGWGKSVLASQYARSMGGRAVWLDLAGGAPAPEQIAEAVSGAFTAGSLGSLGEPEPGCHESMAMEGRASGVVILDDLAAGSDGVDLLSGVARWCAGQGHRLLATSRVRPLDVMACSQDFFLVTKGDLALSPEEAEAIFRGSVGDSVRESTGGQVGYCAMAARLAEGGDALRCQDLDHVLASCVQASLRQVRGSGWERVLLEASLIQRGTAQALSGESRVEVESHLEAIADALPVFRIWRKHKGGALSFHAHDCVFDAVERLVAKRSEPWSTLSMSAVQVVDDPLALGRTSRLLAVSPDSSEGIMLDWMSRNADRMLEFSLHTELASSLDSVELHSLMNHPEILAAWAEALCECGKPEDAAPRARAAADLAAHNRCQETWFRSQLVLVRALKENGDFSEALEAARALLESADTAASESWVQAAAECGALFCFTGMLPDALRVANSALQYSEGTPGRVMFRLTRLHGLLTGLTSGDFAGMVRLLSDARWSAFARDSDRAAGLGNLAIALLETGRVRRAQQGIKGILDTYGDRYGAPTAPLADIISVTLGEFDMLPLESSDSAGDGTPLRSSDVAIARVYGAVAMRACGQIDDALAAAEQSFSLLSSLDFMGFRRLAALEIAASMLALGDTSSARRWTEPYECSDTECNAYHALRASMILAECDRREGSFSGAVKRIGRHVEHIQSESSNWQIAMYIRAFPGLLGVFAVTLGVSGLPAYMLRMLLPEHAERALMECRSVLEPEEWDLLGRKVLGDTAFEQLVRRDGAPVCRVRLFGGLDVSISGRSVAEREWRKRKARLMFAILVARQGKDLAREQLFDQLWPDLNEEKARNNFYVTWSAMKIALMGGPTQRGTACPYVENAGGRCRIAVEAVRSDIDEFEEAVAQAHAAEAAGDVSGAVAACTRLSTVYRGDLLPGDIYDDCFSEARERYRFEFVDSMVRVAELLLGAGEPCEAIVFARRALHADVLREDLYQLVLRCHIAAGQRSGAIDTFIQCRAKLSDELGLDPSSETMALYQEILVMEDAPRYDEYGLD